jgi:putative transcriptional regulator
MVEVWVEPEAGMPGQRKRGVYRSSAWRCCLNCSSQKCHLQGERKQPSRNPTPEEIKRLRELAGDLTQAEAAKLVHSSLRAWQQWKAGERPMHPSTWELFSMKATKLKKYLGSYRRLREQLSTYLRIDGPTPTHS